MAYNTGNPVPSTDAKDFIDNCENIDKAVNSLEATFQDRLGVTRSTYEGVVQGLSFFNVGTFAVGFTLTNSRQTLTHDGHEYSWSGAFPKAVAAGSTPTPLGSGGWIDRSDVTLREQLASGAGPSLLGFSHDEPHSSWTVGAILKQVFRITDQPFAAHMDGINDDSVAFNLASAAAASMPNGGVVVVPSGVMLVKNQCRFYSNVDYVFPRCSIEIHVDDTVPLQAFYGENLSNFSIVGGRFIGSGNAFTDGNQRHLMLVGCYDFSIDSVFGTKSRNDAIVLDSCHDFSVDNIVTPSNYGIGFVCRNNCYNGIIGRIESNGNGDTGTATNATGRGVLFWQSSSIVASRIIAKNNREYNIRCYSQTGDTVGNKQIIIDSLITESSGSELSGKIDVYLYNESLLTTTITINNLMCITAENRTPLAIQGDSILVNNFKAVCYTSAPTSAAIAFYGARNCKVSGVDARGFSALASFSSTSTSANCEVCDFYSEVSNVVNNMHGTGNILRRGLAKHVGAGSSDIGINLDAVSCVEPTIDDIVLDGFWRPLVVNIDAAKMRITRMSDKNSTDVVRVFGTNLQNLEWHGNDWSASVNPAILKGADVRRLNGVSRFSGFANSIPTLTLTHIAGDKIEYSNPVAAGKVGQVCVSSGTPGTWKPYGVIDS